MEQILKSLMESKFIVGDNPAIEAKLDEGTGKLVLVTGDNASGKSFLRRYICYLAHQRKIEPIHLSQEGRSGGGGIPRLMIYGTEEDESTGYNSVKTFQKSVKTSKSRDKQHILFYDEPEIGLSDKYAAALGIELNSFLKESTDNLVACFVATHNKSLALRLENPWHLRLGGCPNLQEWLNQKVEPGNLQELSAIGIDRWHKINKLLKK